MKLTAILPQTVAANAGVLLDQGTGRSSCVMHRVGSGQVSLRGATTQSRALYRVAFSGNIAIPTGGTVGAISLALAVDGEPLGSATAIVTPAAVEDLFNVHAEDLISAPCGCCVTVSVRNVSDQPITVANLNVIIDRVA